LVIFWLVQGFGKTVLIQELINNIAKRVTVVLSVFVVVGERLLCFEGETIYFVGKC